MAPPLPHPTPQSARAASSPHQKEVKERRFVVLWTCLKQGLITFWGPACGKEEGQQPPVARGRFLDLGSELIKFTGFSLFVKIKPHNFTSHPSFQKLFGAHRGVKPSTCMLPNSQDTFEMWSRRTLANQRSPGEYGGAHPERRCWSVSQKKGHQNVLLKRADPKWSHLC